jgi:hypothetical protein
VAKDQLIASQAIAECWQCGAVDRYKSRQGYLMTRAISKLCKCGCKTVLFWYEKKGRVPGGTVAIYMEQTVFCAKETNKDE